ncbi:hypothetical protein GCM10023169_08850 [Georgenia halophila]|uniref:Uncharacterized protein n=1 Tax=Georgenia halophila TaxID=620889 RepID=A0ABP8KXS9_9MICO
MSTDPEATWEQRLALPVLIAALVSVPAVWLTLLEEPYATVGRVGSWLTGAVLVAETVVLFFVTGDKIDWLRRHVWLVLLTIGVVIAVVLAVGPAQLLRLVRLVGALRVLRVRHIVRAGRTLQDRTGLGKRWERVTTVVVTLVVAAFVAIILADPTSRTRVLIENFLGEVGFTTAVVLAGLLLGLAVFILVRNRGRSDDEADRETKDRDAPTTE